MECSTNQVTSSNDSTTTDSGHDHISAVSRRTDMGITCCKAEPAPLFGLVHLLCGFSPLLAWFQKKIGYAVAMRATHKSEICCSCETDSFKSEKGEKHERRLYWPNNLQQPQFRSFQFASRGISYGGLHIGPGGAPHVVRTTGGMFVRWLPASRHA